MTFLGPYDANGDQYYIDDIVLCEVPPAKGSAAPIPVELPVAFKLHQNFPNPFNPLTLVSYDLPVASQVSLRLYDLLGREIALLVDGLEEAGYKSVEWDASNVASGAYFYRLTAGEFHAVRKMVVTR